MDLAPKRHVIVSVELRGVGDDTGAAPFTSRLDQVRPSGQSDVDAGSAIEAVHGTVPGTATGEVIVGPDPSTGR